MSSDNTISSIFLPVQAGRASEEVALQIEAAIVNGRLSPGERLPSEREMQSQFGTGRGVVREAIKILKQKGLLEVKKGAKGGAYIRELDVDNVSESLALFMKQHPLDPEKLVEFRESLDRTITQLAVVNGTASEKEELLRQVRKLGDMLREDEPDFAVTGELDRQLNIMLVRMARNPLFEWVMHAIQMGFSSHDYALYQNPTYRKLAVDNWIDTARAIRDGEVMRALSYISAHYVLLRKCIEEKAARSDESSARFI